jgi:hypothetical protein
MDTTTHMTVLYGAFALRTRFGNSVTLHSYVLGSPRLSVSVLLGSLFDLFHKIKFVFEIWGLLVSLQANGKSRR